MSKNTVKVEYIESGTFCGGEDGVFLSGIKRGDDCIVMSKKYFKKGQSDIKRLQSALGLAASLLGDLHIEWDHPAMQEIHDILNARSIMK